MKFLTPQRDSVQAGFTVIELLLAMGIISVIGLGIVSFQIGLVRNTSIMQTTLSAQLQVRKTFQSFVSEVRTAERANGGAFPLLEVGTSTFTFFANVDEDSDIERIRYYVGTSTVASTTILYKEIVHPTGSVYAHRLSQVAQVVTNISFSTSTPMFQYYDTNYAGTTTALTFPVTNSSVRLVSFTLPIDVNGPRYSSVQSFTTQVAIRNLKDNL
jgi:prepilin-type N-terminal cleavage/methylation domain-containing protein